MYVDEKALRQAVRRLYGTAGHLLKIWLTLKHMGLAPGAPAVEVDTSNSTDSLRRLFSCGASDGSFYIPFAHTPRYLTMKSDASRSIIQTTIQRWGTSGSVVTCDPTSYLDISGGVNLLVATGRQYPLGLGLGESGFAREENTRVAIPLISFAVWFGRQSEIPRDADPAAFLTEQMLRELNITPSEKELVFVDDDLEVTTGFSRLTDARVFAICQPYIDGEQELGLEVVQTEDFSHYERRVRSVVSGLAAPEWMRKQPDEEVRQLIKTGAKSILLFGPPRTGKTRLIDEIVSRDSKHRSTIQIHDGWGYDYLVEGFRPDKDGRWSWVDGPLKAAVEGGKKFIVLEEINRTRFSEALGEVFSLLEDAYRGKVNGILLRSGREFWIPEDVVFLMAMNTIDKSTEDVDDALFGRVAAVEFPPRAEDLMSMLSKSKVPEGTRQRLGQLFAEILNVYPLGHGYFAGLKGEVTRFQIIEHYRTRIRPVLKSYLGQLKGHELARIDNVVDEIFRTTS